MGDMIQSKKLVAACAKLSTDIVAIAADGKLDYTDIPAIIQSLKELAEIGGCNFAALKFEIETMDEGNEQQIKDSFRDAFDIQDDAMECKVEDFFYAVVDWIIATYEATRALIELKA